MSGEGHGGDARGQSVSVIIPAYEADRTLPACLESVLALVHDGPFEVIVASSGRAMADFAFPDDTRLKVDFSEVRTSAAQARNRAVALASHDLLCFIDADVIVTAKWLERLLEASRDGSVAVAGSVVNGTPHRHAGSAEYYLEFMDLHPGRPADSSWHGATCNLLVPRRLWDRFGPFPEDMGGGEDTLLCVQLRGDGLFRFAPEAKVIHQNRTRWSVVFAHQVDFGRFTARLARRSPYRWRFLVRWWVLSPLAFAGRIVSIYARIARWSPSELPLALVRMPIVVVMTAAWGIGLASEGIRLDVNLLAQRGVRRAGASLG